MKNIKPCFRNIAKCAENAVARVIRFKVLFQPCLIILLSASAAWPVTVTFTYDSLNRLEKAEYAGGAVFEHTYDNAGCRLTKSHSFGLNDVIAVLKLMTGDPADVFSSVDINADGKIGMQELVYVMQRLAGLRD
jgi:hypothetical protein